jgi:hypothetical protein
LVKHYLSEGENTATSDCARFAPLLIYRALIERSWRRSPLPRVRAVFNRPLDHYFPLKQRETKRVDNLTKKAHIKTVQGEILNTLQRRNAAEVNLLKVRVLSKNGTRTLRKKGNRSDFHLTPLA